MDCGDLFQNCLAVPQAYLSLVTEPDGSSTDCSIPLPEPASLTNSPPVVPFGCYLVLPCIPSPQLFMHSYQVGQRSGLHLMHYLTPLNLDGNLSRTQFRGDLLVEKP
jgi:hypothetical protein